MTDSKTAASRRVAALDAFDVALRDTMQLQRTNSLNEWTAASRSYYRPSSSIRMAGHFDMRPAFVILDQRLATWGIVEFVDEGTDAEIRSQLKQHVDSAAYARHLLLKRASAERKSPITIELALIAVADDTVRQIGVVLRELLRDTDSLFQLGVGVLQHHETDGYAGRLRRALPWLLTATQQWFASSRSRAPKSSLTPAAIPFGRLTNLRLTNYRHAGLREVVFHRDHRVHLVHGPNGSGKTSLVEALELASRGRAERIDLADEKDYVRVIQNRASTSPALVALSCDEGKTWREGEVTSGGFSAPLDPSLNAGSFRMDQPLMERLVGSYPHQRARNYLDAFFPEAQDPLRRYQVADDSLKSALTALEPRVEELRRARECLNVMKDWKTVQRARTNEPYVAQLNRWLELTALIDIGDKEQQARMALSRARVAGWSGRRNEAAAISALEPDAELPAAIARWTREKDDIQSTMSASRPSVRSRTHDDASVQGLTTDQIGALNVVSGWLFEESTLASLGAFGDRVDRVFNGQMGSTYGTVVIGADGWTDSLTVRLDAISAACAALVSNAVPEWPGYGHCSDFAAAVVKQQEMLEAGAVLSETFESQLRAEAGKHGEFDGSLIAALNELLALFTPARWAYQDIQLPSDVGAGKLALRLAINDGTAPARAELRLNTAALNLFTVALFLLCAGRVEKPIPMLIFDDPLQNMDELTSTALARGLSRLVRMWHATNRPEELVFLFHGYEDLRRFQEELPSTTYRLPWLSPSTVDDQKQEIAAEPLTTANPEVLQLGRMLSAGGP